jgi:hypothetical protein
VCKSALLAAQALNACRAHTMCWPPESCSRKNLSMLMGTPESRSLNAIARVWHLTCQLSGPSVCPVISRFCQCPVISCKRAVSLLGRHVVPRSAQGQVAQHETVLCCSWQQQTQRDVQAWPQRWPPRRPWPVVRPRTSTLCSSRKWTSQAVTLCKRFVKQCQDFSRQSD